MTNHFSWRKPRKESGADIITSKLLSIFCSLHIPNVTSPHILLTTMDAQLPTKPLINLITINLRPWGWTSQPWKRHLGPAREGLLTRKLICYLWIRDWFRECLGKLDSWSCFPIAQTTSIRGGWFWLLYRLAPILRWRWPLHLLLRLLRLLLLPFSLSVVIPPALITPVPPLHINSLRVLPVIFPLISLSSHLIKMRILSFFTVASRNCMPMNSFSPRNILFNPSQNNKSSVGISLKIQMVIKRQ